MHRRFFIALFAIAGANTSFAHHSFAPHFDANKPVRISGVITKFEARNPHAYVHISSVDENGQSREYVCESHGVTQLTRNGITPAMLAVGASITVTGSQARVDPHMCFFDTVELADGRVLNVNGPQRAPGESAVASAPAAAARTDIYGKWLLVPANRPTSGPQPMIDSLTAAGQAAVAAYDPFVDDPTFRCDPVAVRRVWFAPGTPLEITREGDNVILRHEWMDVRRVVHLDETEHPADGPRSSLGHSIGHFDGDTLVIETANYSAGVLNQYVEMPGQPTRGLLHSAALTSVERLRLDGARQRLAVTIELSDPVFFTRSFDPAIAEYAPTDLSIEPFDCHPENPDHTLRQE
ncbi:MAG TPA: DUF6152 family protein [Gammaproteobacteria bacterium]|jgi:hypothetical protein